MPKLVKEVGIWRKTGFIASAPRLSTLKKAKTCCLHNFWNLKQLHFLGSSKTGWKRKVAWTDLLQRNYFKDWSQKMGEENLMDLSHRNQESSRKSFKFFNIWCLIDTDCHSYFPAESRYLCLHCSLHRYLWQSTHDWLWFITIFYFWLGDEYFFNGWSGI